MKRVSISMSIEALSGGKYLVRGNFDREVRGENVLYKRADRVFDKHSNKEKNKKDAIEFVQKHQDDVLSNLD